MEKFSADSLLAKLIEKFAHLNDDNKTAQNYYDKIMASQPKK
jgi:hypothetical protein